MKVLGQLEGAMLENLTSDPANAPTGRMYINTATPSQSVPRVYTGTSWQPFALGQSTSLVSQNSGNACTVDWSQGLNQQVVLTGHCTISFSNPVSGATHMLVITQRATETASTTPYQYKLNMIDQATRRRTYQPVSVLQSSESAEYSWLYAASVKAAYANVPARMSDPPAALATTAPGIDIHPTLGIVGGVQTSSPFATTIRYWDGGAKLYWQKTDVSTPTTFAGSANGFAYHPDGHTAFVTSHTSPYIEAVGVDIYGVPNKNKYADPGTVPTGNAQGVAVHPSGLSIAVGHTTTPFISGYPIGEGAFGTKYTNPVSLPAAQVNCLAFSPLGDYIACAGQTTPFLQVWVFDPFTGFGAISSNPGSLPAGGPAGSTGKGVAWRPQGDYIAMAMTTTPYLVVYPFNRTTGAFGAKISPTALAGSASAVQWSPDGQYLFVACGTTPYLYVFDFSASTLGTLATLDGSNPGAALFDLAVAPNGEYLFASVNASPYIMAYPVPRKVRNYLRGTP